jgi:hypothetical protein
LCFPGASLNVIIDDDKTIKDGAVIVVPGHKERQHTIINVPGADGKVGSAAWQGTAACAVPEPLGAS